MTTLNTRERDEVLDEICEAEDDAGDAGPSHLEVKSGWENQQRTFEAFRAANDRRLDEIRTKGSADPVTEEEVNRLNDELGRLQHKAALPRRSLAASGGTLERAAISAIGREVMDIGRKVDAMRRGPSSLRSQHQAKMAAYQAERTAAEVKRNRPPWLASRWPGYGGQRGYGQANAAGAKTRYAEAMVHWIKTGNTEFRGTKVEDLYRAAYGSKSIHSELNPAGGYLITPERRRGSPLEALMAELTPMRQLATVHTLTEGDVFQIPQNLKGTAAGWVGERDARPETVTPELAMTEIPAMELYAMPAATQRWLDHADSNVESWLAQEVAEAFSLQEGPAYITGDGVKRPRGLLSYSFVEDPAFAFDNWVHGSFRLLETGVAGNFAAAPNGGDILIRMQTVLKTAYKANASWLLSRTSHGAVRLLKDSQGAYLWRPGIAAGAPPSLLAADVHEEPNMPEIGVDSTSIGYGDWARVYCIVEKGGIRVVRDPFTQKPYVLFYTTKLVGGGVQNFDAACFLRFST